MEFAQRLVQTRRGTFLISLLAAALAGAMLLVYLNRYRNSLRASGAPVTVLVAQHTISKGTPGSLVATNRLFTATTIRASQLRNGAFSDVSSLSGRVAAQDIYAGEQLTTSNFVAGAETLASALATNQRIVSIPLDSAHGLSGELQAGDHVDVYAGFSVIPLNADGTPIAGGQSRPVLRLIMSDITVVAVGSKSGFGSSTTNVSLKVNDVQAAKLAFASDNGKLWLALRPATGGTSSPPTIVTVETMLLGQSPVTAIHSFGAGR